RRVHTTAPLKPCDAREDDVFANSFRRVHTTAPLKRDKLCKWVERLQGLPSCSHDGPIEATSTRTHTYAGRPLPSCSHDGPIEARTQSTTGNLKRSPSVVFTRR